MSIKEQLIYKYMETKKEQSEIMAIMAICLFFTCMISCIFGDFMFAGLQSVLKTCRRRRREGVVGKCYVTQDYFKAKVDLPKKQKLHKFDNRPNYPPMPLDRIERALNHAIDQVGVDNWKDKSKALPILARQLETEGREHYFNMPRNVYQIYLESLINDKYRNKEVEKNDI